MTRARPQRARQPGADDDQDRQRQVGAGEVAGLLTPRPAAGGPRSRPFLCAVALGACRWTSRSSRCSTQDGITNGAVYALLALALVLVFAVTRVIWVPSGEFVAYGTLTLAGLQLGKPPGTIGLLVGMALVAGAMEAWSRLRGAASSRGFRGSSCAWTGIPVAIAGVAWWLASPDLPFWAQILVTLALVTPLGPLLYRIAYQPLAEASRAGAADRLGRRALRADRARPLVLRRRGLAHAGRSRRRRSSSAASTSACRACSSC